MRMLRSRWETWRSLDRDSQGLLVRALLLLLPVALSTTRGGSFDRTRRVLSRIPVLLPSGSTASPRRVVEMTSSAAALLPFNCSCLIRSLVSERLISALGYPCELHLGLTVPKKKNFEAHAWLEHEGVCLDSPNAGALIKFQPVKTTTGKRESTNGQGTSG